MRFRWGEGKVGEKKGGSDFAKAGHGWEDGEKGEEGIYSRT